MKLCVLLLLTFIVGIYCNCGCLSCNKHFHVLSPPGARVKVIHRNVPCSCPTSLPYSVEIPVNPHARTWSRSYGYEVEAERLKPDEPVQENLCPIQQEYDCQMQIPIESRPRYLVGLVASTDRIIMESPPPRPLHRLCQRPHLERFSVPLLRYNPSPVQQRIIWKPRGKRSINYKLLAVNSNNFQMSNKRKNLQSRKWSQQKNKAPFVMVPEETARRSPILGSKKKSIFRRRFKRRAHDDFFESEENDNEPDEKSKSKRRISSKQDESVPMMFQSMPLLKMLSIPLKYISGIENNPIVGAIPKVLRVSRRYFMDFAKGFVDDYKRMRRKKKLFKRDCDCSREKREVAQIPTHQQLVVSVIKDLARKTQRFKRSKDSTYYEFTDIDSMTWDQIVEELKKIVSENSDGEYKTVAKEFLSILKEVAKDKGHRNKRDANFLESILKLLKAEPLHPTKQKRSVPELEINTIKEEVQRSTKHAQRLIEKDFFEDLRIYDNLFTLENLKVGIVRHDLTKIQEAQDLKEAVLQEIMDKITANEDESVGKWIKTIVHLQKFHCVLRLLKNDPNSQVMPILSTVNFVKAGTRRELLKFLKQRQSAEAQAELDYLNGLKLLMASGSEDKIKEESELIWQSNNLKKLQRDSIAKITEKLVKKQRIRQELKILFDLQKQLEECLKKQQQLLDQVSK